MLAFMWGVIMSKIMKLEFEKGLSIDDIKAEMCYYRGNGHTVMCEINGEEVYSDDPEFHEIFERLKLGMSKEEFKKYKEFRSEINNLENCISKAGSIENYAYYRYYFGLASRYVKPEKRDEFFDFVLNNFSSYSNAFVLATQLMLVINNTDFDVYMQINNILNSHRSFCGNDFVEYGLDVDRAIWLVKEYGKKGSLIETLFFKDTTRDYIENTQNRIDVLERKLK